MPETETMPESLDANIEEIADVLMADGQTEPSKPPLGEQFTVKTVETLHRTYLVRGEDPARAETRLRNYLRDPQMMLSGIVEPQGEGERVRWQIRGEKAMIGLKP